MDECSGEVQPFPREVASGLKTIAVGLNVAFLLAGLAHAFITQTKQDSRNLLHRTSALNLGLVLSAFAHVISIAESVKQVSDDRLWTFVSNDAYSVHSSPARTTTEVVNAIILSLLIWSKLSGRVKHAALASCLSNALFMAMLRSTTDRKYGSVYLILTVVSGLTSVVSLTAAKKHTWTAAALCAAYALMLGFQHVLYLSQAGQLLQAPVATLCFAMISGCVRFVFTAVCVEQEPVIPDSANIEQTEPTSESDETIDSVKCNTNDFSVVATDGLEDANDVGSNAHREGHSVDHNEDHSVHHSDEHSDDHSATESDIDDDNSPFGEINPLLARSSSYQEQNTSRRELLRYVFHEMRAPLNSICMAVDLLTHHYKAGTTPKSRVLDLETLQIIEEATLTMERTLKDSMTLQKIEEGLLRPQLKIFSVHDLCDDIQDALSSVLQSTSVSLIYNIETAIPEQIAGDHFRVRHVVAHVLSNAIKFSRTGGVVNMKVFLHTLTQEEISSLPMDTIDSARTCSTEDTVPHLRLDAIIGREFVVFSISDNGVGMSSELQESDIFKPFNQLKTEEVNGFRGSGLGLAICKKIMSFLGGSITYSSIEGIGTTFTVMFPLTRLDDDTGEDLVFDRDAFDIPQAPNTSPLGPLVSPRSVKTKAVSHAKSFRGEKLLSILHNQSNVFECPTPKLNSSTSDNFRTSFDFEESPRKFTPPIPIPTSSRPTSGRLAVAFSNSVKGIQMPSVDYGDRQERSEVDDVPMFQLDLEGHSPTRTWKKAMSPSRKQTTEEALDTVNRAISYSMDTLAASSSLHSSFRSDAPSELLDYDSKTYQRSPSQHSPSTLSDTRSPKSDYVTLTEKNVNLHILRTASNEGVRILKQKLGHRKVAATKEELAMILSQCRVLVVDDAASNRKLLSMLLKRAGFGTVDLVEDGQAAVDYCKAQSPDQQPSIIFMDNTMPKMTGIEASVIIRAGGFKHLIIGVTGNSLEEELDEFITAGADLVIVKPLKNQSLEMLLGFIQVNGFDSSHGYRIDQVGQQYTWVPRGHYSGDK